jgi:uncharacterized tellurite resistance protein B-like protein
MLRSLKQYFDQHLRPTGTAPATQHALHVATAALLFEVMRADREMKDAERHAVSAAIEASFGLSGEETAKLLHLAAAQADQATDTYQFTALINQHYTAEQKAQVVENLWQVAAADHAIDRFERTLVHKVADLLHVPRATQIAARERARRAASPPKP